jgi:hypothetical protein
MFRVITPAVSARRVDHEEIDHANIYDEAGLNRCPCIAAW